MNILILSDLHLSSCNPFEVLQNGQRIDEKADVVVLAGDIDEGTKGFRWARETFPDKPIVMVAGNHEFYEHHWMLHIDDMRAAARKYDIEFLETDGIDMAGVRFLGCTLWTDFKLFNEKGDDQRVFAMRLAKSSMNDYQFIKMSRYPEFAVIHAKNLVPEFTEMRHQGSVKWLEKKLSKSSDPSKTVVVTHHAPHPNSIPARLKDNLLSASYASDLTHLMGKAGLWIHGHMHTSSDYTINGTRVVCNPLGYIGKNGGMENTNFNPALILEI